MLTRKLAILFSGNGSNMQNLIETLHQKVFQDSNKQNIKLEVAITLCNNPSAYGIKRAQNLGIPCIIISHKDFSSRCAFDEAMIKALESHSIDLCVLAGFMRILTPTFTQHFPTINIHPSLLPAHKGAHAIADTFNAHDPYGGVSVHWVNEELDGGALITQRSVALESEDTLETFEHKIHALEYKLYPIAVLQALNLDITSLQDSPQENQ